MAEHTISSSEFNSFVNERFHHARTGWGRITLVDMPQEYHLQATIDLLKVLTKERGAAGVYMTTMKGYQEIQKIFSANGVDTSKLYFVDVISKMYGLEPEATPQCEFVSSPINIQSISNAIKNYLDKIKDGERFVIFDSLTTILLYNSLPRIVQFTTAMAEHLRAQHVNAILVMMTTAKGSTNERLIGEIKPIIDEVINVPQ